MKREYDIFLAGSKSLDKQRNQIKAYMASRNATTKLNSSNEKECVLFSVYTYENFPAIIDDTLGKQSAYNTFIKEKADLAIFILDGVIGDKTQVEFQVAYNSLTQSSRKAPGIIVLSKKSQHQDPGIASIQRFLSDNNQYYIEYENDAQIPAILDDNLNKFIHDRRVKEMRRRRTAMKALRLVFMALSLAVIIVALGIGIVKSSDKKPDKKIEPNGEEVIEEIIPEANPVDRLIIEAAEETAEDVEKAVLSPIKDQKPKVQKEKSSSPAINKEDVIESLFVSPSALDFVAEGGAQALFLISTSNWSVRGLPEWVRLSETSGSADSQRIVVEVSSNTGPQRHGTIVFVAGSRHFFVPVLQQASQ